MRSKVAVTLMLVLFVCAGCATRKATITHGGSTRLHVTTVDDAFILSWASSPNTDYTVLYCDNLVENNWKTLNNHTNIKGTGKYMQIRDDAPAKNTKYYRLFIGSYPPSDHD